MGVSGNLKIDEREQSTEPQWGSSDDGQMTSLLLKDQSYCTRYCLENLRQRFGKRLQVDIGVLNLGHVKPQVISWPDAAFIYQHFLSYIEQKLQ